MPILLFMALFLQQLFVPQSKFIHADKAVIVVDDADGGLVGALADMALASKIGCKIELPREVEAHVALFAASLEERWDEFAATVGGPPRQVECTAADGSTHVDALVDTAGTYDLNVPAIEGLYGRTYQQEADSDLQQFLASAIGANPELTVRLFHDPADPAIPITVSEDFEAVLAAAGYDVQLATFAGCHNFPPKELSLKVLTEILSQ